jgi:RND family efflux transporter MFP subunit
MTDPSSCSLAPQVGTCIHFFALVCLIGSLTGCKPAETTVATAPPAPVNVIVPVERVEQEYDEFTGRVMAVATVDVRARVGGYLVKVGFKDGDDVKKDQLLFQIDPRPYEAQLNAAKAQLQQAQAERDYATREESRLKPLQAEGAASATELSKAQDMMARALASISKANAEIEARQLDFDYASVKSPIDGRASKANFSEGNLIAGDTLLTTIVATKPINVTIDIDERRFELYREQARRKGTSNLTRIRDANIEMAVALPDEKGFPHIGVIDFVDNQVNPQTGTIRVRAEFANTDGALVPGQFVRARLKRAEPRPQLLVPDRAIGRDQDRKYLLAVNDQNKVEYRPVNTGDLFGEERSITSGLKAGERIVLDGLQRARPGAEVAPTVVKLESTTQPTTTER